jgi:branched-chain amino acid transport system permease protein
MSLALGWNFLSGFTGYINFGYAAFVGIGAYLTVISITLLGLPWYGALALATLVTGIGGTLITVPILRLRGAYFAIAMLGLALGGKVAVGSNYLEPWTNGTHGIIFTAPVDYRGQYYLMLGVTLLLVYLTYRLATSPIGLRWLAIREDEVLASALGVKTMREKIKAMVIHTAVAGLIGGLLAFNISYIDPGTVFALKYTEMPIVMVLAGGLGTVVGPIVGAIVFVLVEEYLWATFPTLHLLFFGLAIMVVVLFIPNGLVGKLKEQDYIPMTRKL